MTEHLKGGTVEKDEEAITRQWPGKHSCGKRRLAVRMEVDTFQLSAPNNNQ
jgi:hypothetical protein